MSQLTDHITAEQIEQRTHGYRAFETGFVDGFYGRLQNDGIPLAELDILKPISDDMSNFAYTCSINGIAQYSRRVGDKMIAGVLFPELQEIGWQISRTHLTRLRGSNSNIYDRVDKHLYISSEDIVRINDDFNIERPDCEFELGKILRSMAKTLVLNNVELVERPL